MKKTVAALSLLTLAACATPRQEGPPTAFRLTSPGSFDNAMLPPKSAGNFAQNPNCTGQNVSPPLAWSNAPDKTRSFAIIWDDQAGRAGLGVSHAVIYGIPANVTSFAEGRQHQMHALLHITAAVLVLPYVALAGLFMLIGEAAGAKGLPALLDVALHHANWIVRWGIYGIPLLWLALAIAGFLAPFRRMGALALCLLATGSLVVLIDLQSSRMALGQLLFLAPCVAIAATSAWLFVRAGAIG